MTGTVDTIVTERGFFFVLGDDNRRYFAHRTALADVADFGKLSNGQAVSFDPQESDRGPRCNALKLTDPA
jgi:cold shock CspA family protein